MQILREQSDTKLKNLKAGDVFSWLNCMDDNAPNIYRLIDYKTAYCFTKNKIEYFNDSDFNSLIYLYKNPILDLRNK